MCWIQRYIDYNIYEIVQFIIYIKASGLFEESILTIVSLLYRHGFLSLAGEQGVRLFKPC